jgi:nucleotide-binding universal stress UspA family protein
VTSEVGPQPGQTGQTGQIAPPDGKHSCVVFGVDGSDPSRRALLWAARQAAFMRVPLRVVTVWTFPEHPAPLGIVAHVPWQDELMAEAQITLDALVAELVPEDLGVPIETVVIRGNAAKVLLEQARDADLLVVGRTGQSAVAELVMGSVGERCVRHARSPAVMVP